MTINLKSLIPRVKSVRPTANEGDILYALKDAARTLARSSYALKAVTTISTANGTARYVPSFPLTAPDGSSIASTQAEILAVKQVWLVESGVKTAELDPMHWQDYQIPLSTTDRAKPTKFCDTGTSILLDPCPNAIYSLELHVVYQPSMTETVVDFEPAAEDAILNLALANVVVDPRNGPVDGNASIKFRNDAQSSASAVAFRSRFGQSGSPTYKGCGGSFVRRKR